MPRVTLASLESELAEVKRDVANLDTNKVDSKDFKYQLRAITDKIDTIMVDVARINGYGRWGVVLVLTAVFTAILNLVLRGTR